MIQFPVQADIVKLIQQQTESLKPFAEANQVELVIDNNCPTFSMKFYPESVVTDFVHLLCKVIIFSPQEHRVEVSISENNKDHQLHISIFAFGALLPIPHNALTILENDFSIQKGLKKGMRYCLHIPIENDRTVRQVRFHPKGKKIGIPDFYKKFRKQLKTHITTYQNLEKRAEEISKKDGILLKKINALILAHIGDESFDTFTLCKALALSRTQLYRKIKPLIRQSPGKYIRFVRLQRAKEMLANSDLPIGDIADQVGFPDQSHFTRAFKNQYGYNPTYVRNNQKQPKKGMLINKKQP